MTSDRPCPCSANVGGPLDELRARVEGKVYTWLGVALVAGAVLGFALGRASAKR